VLFLVSFRWPLWPPEGSRSGSPGLAPGRWPTPMGSEPLRLLHDDSGPHERAAAASCAFSQVNLPGCQAERVGALLEEVEAGG
jgi:hypothetical protein